MLDNVQDSRNIILDNLEFILDYFIYFILYYIVLF